MAEEARDSGICVDNDNDSVSTSSSRDLGRPSYVQMMRKRFECLAKENDLEYHPETNWWLEEENVAEGERGESLMEVRNDVVEEQKNSLKSQHSRESHKSNSSTTRTITITPATPPVQSLSSRKDFPHVLLSDYQGNNETNDSDSFDSDDNEHDENVFPEEGKNEEEIEVITRHPSNLRPSRPDSTASQTSTLSQSKLINIIRELLENEENYVRTLRTGINNYTKIFDRKDLPKTMRGQKYRIFANIKSIYKFHEHEFLPALRDCGDEPDQIAEVFTNFITRDFFYGYIIYAINRKRSQLLCNYHVQFFKKIQNEVGDRLGINSFLLQPIQRLPRYQLLLNEIIKDLSKDLENMKQVIAACCVAEKSVQRLLDTVDESMSINDIRNCYEIDVLCQGKFKKMDEFDIYDWELRRRFRGKVFLFERCVVYTEALDREYLEYRGHFGSDKLGIIYKEGKSKFRLFSKRRGHKEAEFRHNMSTVVEWNEIITAMLMKFVVEEKKRNEMRQRKASMINLRQVYIPDSVRSSMVSTKSDQSYFSIGSYRSSSGNSSLGRDSGYELPRQSHWYV